MAQAKSTFFPGFVRRLGRPAILIAAAGLLSACAAEDEILQGEREAVRIGPSKDAIIAEQSAQVAAQPVRLPSIIANADWTHRAGSPSHLMPHAALAAAPALSWSTKIGAGNSRGNRITSDPIVAGGVIFTMDSASRVAATTMAGEVVWSTDLTPSTERATQGGGGGLAFGNDMVFATTGFGEVVALDPATGGEIWTQDLDAFGGAAPTYFDGRVYLAARDSIAWAINADSGRIDWQVVGTPSGSNLTGGPGVAVNETIAVFPFASAELIGTFRQGGVRLWNAAVLGKRKGTAIGQITDIAADPVIAGDTVYTANPGGRMVALDVRTGQRRWTANIGAYSVPVVAGTALFAVSDDNKLTRLDRETGAIAWQQDLPLFTTERERRKRAIVAHYGPVLAGGQLWLASTDGFLRAFDPQTGGLTRTLDLPGGAASAPAVAGGALYVVSKRGQLLAFR